LDESTFTPGESARAVTPRSIWAASALATVVLSGFAVGGYEFVTSAHERRETARLRTAADLHAEQISGWLTERRRDLRLAASDGRLLALTDAPGGSAPAESELRARLQGYRDAGPYRSVAILDAGGRPVAAVGEPLLGSATLARHVARALATGAPVEAGLGDPAGTEPPETVDLLTPLPPGPRGAGHVVLLQIDLARGLYPMLRGAPFDSETAETQLVARTARAVVMFGPRRSTEVAAVETFAPADRSRLAARLMASAANDELVEGIDYRGVPVIGTARRVPGTPWTVIAKMDRAEMDAAARRYALWIGFVGALALALVVAAVMLVHQRRALQMTRDVERHRREQLRTAELLAAIANASTDAIFAKDRDGRYLLANPAALRRLGRSAEEVLGRDDSASLPPLEVAAIRATDLRAMNAAAAETYEERLHLAGREAVLLSTKGPLRDADGRAYGMFGISRDVTDRVRADERERARQRRLLLAVEGAGHGVWDWDLAARTLYMSPQALAPAGLPPECDDPSARWRERMHPDDVPGFETAIALHLDGTTPEYRHEYRIADGRGGWRTVLDQGRVIERDAEGRGLRAVGVRTDVTAQREDERELLLHREHLAELVRTRTAELELAYAELQRQSEIRREREVEVSRLNAELARRVDEAESASRAKSAFVANMSHEIRTPLNAVIGLTHLLRRASTDARQSERLDKVGAAAEHLLGVVDDVLDFSKIEAGKLVLDDGPVDLRAILGGLAAWAAERATQKGVRFRIDVAPDLPRALRGDATRLRQALLNYVSNAVKFTERGEIALAASVVEASDAEAVVRLEVRDTGIGIEPSVLARLFAPFEQADGSTTRRFGGSGLGLVITRLLAHEMGGAAGADSVAGVGSCFWFTARLARGSADECGAAQDPHRDSAAGPVAEDLLRHAWQGRRVLLAEDNPINREVAGELLAIVGLQVDPAGDGAAAVELARDHDYDVILMDVQMPVMDGLEAARRIRAMPGRAATPIVAMTAAISDADRQAAERAGMSAFVPKPFAPAALYRCLQQWLPPVGAAAEQALKERESRADSPTAVPATPDARALLEKLSAVPGLDAKRGLPFGGGDPASYLDFLERFVVQAERDLADCRASLAADDVRGAAEAAHSLKGAAAFAGATDVRARAVALESALRTDAAPASAGLAELERALGTLGAAVAELRGLPADDRAERSSA
jgi:PAS domain S-box-containing protein